MLREKLESLANEVRRVSHKSDKLSIDGMTSALNETRGAVGEKDINFYDHTGELWYSYTLDEIQELLELPPLPEIPGLIAQSWNWSLEDLKALGRPMTVGATFITDDGATRLYINISKGSRTTVPLYFSQSISGGVSIDWGDGTPTETINGTGVVNTSHTYAETGSYVISLMPDDDCELSLGTGVEHEGLFGQLFDPTRGTSGEEIYETAYIRNMLQKVELGKCVYKIIYYCFSRCMNLISVSIPNSITNIETHAFSNAANLIFFVVPNGNTKLGSYVALGTRAFYTLSLPNGFLTLGEAIFQGSSVRKLDIPTTVKILPYSLFRDSGLIKKINKDDATKVGNRAFIWAYAFEGTHIGEGATVIEGESFSNCYSLTYVHIPNTIQTIKYQAFRDCFGMRCYDFSEFDHIPTLEEVSAFNGISDDCKIFVPAALLNEWKAATNWVTYADRITVKPQPHFYLSDYDSMFGPYQFVEGMTWREFVESDYCAQITNDGFGIRINADGAVEIAFNGGAYHEIVCNSHGPQSDKADDLIENAQTYYNGT